MNKTDEDSERWSWAVVEPRRGVMAVWLAILVIIAVGVNQAGAQAGGVLSPERLAPDYVVPYGPMPTGAITAVLERVLGYLEVSSPAGLVDKQTQVAITDFEHPKPAAVLRHGAFPIISYEWGVTYAGMLHAWESTGDPRFKTYVQERMEFIRRAAPYFQALGDAGLAPTNNPLRSVLYPRALDDAGSMCAAMIQAQRAGLADLRPLIHRYAEYIRHGQYRLPDGTLARRRPMANTLWLDDLYMSVPALAQLGRYTGDPACDQDAIRQIVQFSSRMLNHEKHLYLHGWVEGMPVHPAFYWGRANGWAFLAMTELLDALPPGMAGRDKVLADYQELAGGLAACQGANGLWHQLLDRPDSYYETSASAIYAYCLARGIDRGWLDPLAYGPMTLLAWNGVAREVNATGQVEDTCVGTGMGFDPAFYYARPRSVYAAHGYGPVLLAGAEMIRLLQTHVIVSNGGMQFGRPAADRR